MMDTEASTFNEEGEELDKEAGFISFYRMELNRVVWMVTAGVLQPKDVIVFLTYLRFMQWRTGRVRCSIDKLAEILERSKSTLYSSIRRLKENKLLVPTIDETTGEKVLIVNPGLVKASGGKRRGYTIKNYNEAVQYNKPNSQEIDNLDL